MGSNDITEKNRDRIISSFRFYRYGSDTNIFENKLVNWWTATEYLTSNDKSSGSIANRVIGSITPVLCLSYMKKHLSATKRALGELRYTYNERDISSYETHEFKDILLSDKAKETANKPRNLVLEPAFAFAV